MNRSERPMTLRALSICLAGVIGSLTPCGRGDDLSVEDAGRAARHFVIVKTYFKRSESEKPRRNELFEYFETDVQPHSYDAYLNDRRPKREFGILLADGTVLVRDSAIDPSYFDRVEIEDADANTSAAEREAVLRDTPGMVIRVLEPGKLRALPVAFESLAPVNFGDPGITSVVACCDTPDWKFVIGKTKPTVRVGPGDVVEAHLTVDVGPASPALLLDRERRIVGVALTGELPLSAQTSPVWRGADVIERERVSFRSLNAETGPAAAIASRLYEVRVKYRQTVVEQDGFSMFGVTIPLDLDPMSLGAEKLPIEQYFYGIPIGSGRLLVPFPADRQFVKKIEGVTIRISDSDMPARFLGSIQDLGAFVIGLDEGTMDARVEFTTGRVPENETLVAVRTTREFGERIQELTYSRVAAHSRGKGDRVDTEVFGRSQPGTVYGDLNGRVVAVALERRERDREIEKLRAPMDSFMEENPAVIYEASALAEIAQHPERHFDATIAPRSEADEKRRMWLGVEYEPMQEELARTLSVEKATKDGSLGFVVSTVYAGSPAESLGIRSGDVLLRIIPGNGLEPIELAGDDEMSFSFDEFELELPPMMEGLGLDLPESRPWKSRDNLLTQILEILGDGTDVELEFLRDGELRSAQTSVQLAPPDFDSAEKHKDAATGLTLKELTYEVRLALKIPDGEDPVVVAKVEEGSPAAVARIAQYDLVTRINNEQVRGLESFRQHVGRVVPGEKRVLRFALQKLGRTRIADVTIE